VTEARRLLNDRRVRLGVWLVGLAIVWFGYQQQSNPVIAVGLVLASSTYWPLLAPTYRYRRAVATIVEQWQRALGAARSRYLAARATRGARVAAIPAPAACAASRDRLLELVSAPEDQQATADRIREGIEERRATAGELETLKALPGPEAQAYAEAVGALLSEFADELALMTAEFERALSEAIARIEGLRVPARLTEAHRRLAGSLRTEYIGLSTYDRAVHDLQLDAALAAVEQLQAARELTRAATAEVNGQAPAG
jgi:hypothetical protein